MNLTQAGLSTSFSLDAVNRQLSNNATTGVSYDPTSRSRVSSHETDKQAEDNATWYFEYRALLNSKLTTLITSLTSAYTTDLDASMGAQAASIWGTKSAMQGVTGVKTGATTPALIDPGAARTTFAYLGTFTSRGTGAAGGGVVMAPTAAPDWKGDTAGLTPAAQSASATATFFGTDSAGAINATATGSITGTTTFMSGGSSTFILDKLKVNMDPYNYPPSQLPAAPTEFPFSDTFATRSINKYDNDKEDNFKLSDYDRDPTNTVVDTARKYRAIGNNLEYTLYKFFERPENLDLIRFGLFKDVYVVGTSSLPTGSQTQGSISMDWNMVDQKVVIKQERYACFFHS